MEKTELIGKIIKRKRLSLNLRMDDVAKKVGITRATLWSIEKGSGNYSINTLLAIINFLDLSLNLSDKKQTLIEKERASRLNTSKDKKINRFIIMCVEQYANSANISSREAYKKMLENDIILDLTNDYEDFHGMSNVYLNSYIYSIIGGDDE